MPLDHTISAKLRLPWPWSEYRSGASQPASKWGANGQLSIGYDHRVSCPYSVGSCRRQQPRFAMFPRPIGFISSSFFEWPLYLRFGPVRGSV
jgi:hypothetical protein